MKLHLTAHRPESSPSQCDRLKVKGSILLLTALLLGCSKSDPHFPGYTVAAGDVAPFILECASSYGARPLKTSGFSKIEAQWRCKMDRDGVQIYLLGDHFAQVQSLLLGAFGQPAILPKTNENGHISMGAYAAPATGAAIQFLLENAANGTNYTQILILRSGALKP